MSYCQNCNINQHFNSEDDYYVDQFNVQHSKDASSQTTNIFSDHGSSDTEYYKFEKQENDEFVREMIKFEKRCLDSSHEIDYCSRNATDKHDIDSDTDSDVEIFIDPNAFKIDERLIPIRLIF